MAKLPTLTPAGWVSDVTTMSTRLMDYFVSSDYSQSTVYMDEISSLPYLVRVNGNDPIALKREAQATLTRYLMRYFEDVNVITSVKESDVDARYELILDINITHEGRNLSLGRVINVADSRITKIVVREAN